MGQAASWCLTGFLSLLAGGQGGPALGCRRRARAGCAAALGVCACPSSCLSQGGAGASELILGL